MPIALLLISIAQSSSYLQAGMKSPPNLYDWTKHDEGNNVGQWLKENEHALSYYDACTLTVSWSDEESKLGSGVHELISFLADPHEEEEIGTAIYHSESGMNVSVGVRYLPVQGKPSIIQIALALKGSPSDVFYEIDRSEAEVVWRKSDMLLGTTKCARIANRIFTFHLSCQNGKTFLSPLRRRKQ